MEVNIDLIRCVAMTRRPKTTTADQGTTRRKWNTRPTYEGELFGIGMALKPFGMAGSLGKWTGAACRLETDRADETGCKNERPCPGINGDGGNILPWPPLRIFVSSHTRHRRIGTHIKMLCKIIILWYKF
jgi:hypothetical protein